MAAISVGIQMVQTKAIAPQYKKPDTKMYIEFPQYLNVQYSDPHCIEQVHYSDLLCTLPWICSTRYLVSQ